MQIGIATALIDSTVYEVGDTFGDYKLLQVNKNSLLLLNIRTNQNEEIMFSENPAETMGKETKKNI